MPANPNAIVQEKRFVLLLALGTALLSIVPWVLAVIGIPTGAHYLGFQYNTDDHMVYSAWMRQAMDGHLLMDNRFTTDAQPGLTVHLYFFLLGLIAKLTGIPFAATLARASLSAAFVLLLSKLAYRLSDQIYARKLILAVAIFGGGVGFLVWHNFGVDISRPTAPFLKDILLGHLPTDVWQPEGFVFPSMLTNSLFMASLCLILTALLAVLSAEKGPRRVFVGAVSIALLMNIHSYDVLLVALVLAGLLIAQIGRDLKIPLPWVVRCLIIGSGAILPALWFIHVLQSDAVFQARAATETYSPNFRAVVFGYLPLMLFGMTCLFLKAASDTIRMRRRLAGALLVTVVFGGLFVLAASHQGGYFLSPELWVGVLVLVCLSVFLLSDENPAFNLIVSWALIGTIAIYFPGLFQRKLAMGLSIPWSILTALCFDHLIRKLERNERNLATILALILLSATSIRWMARELYLAKTNVSNTTVHPVYLSSDMNRILAFLNEQPGKKIVIAPPGVQARATVGDSNEAAPDDFLSPTLPDLNAIISGLTGSYTFAGHWSETPDYAHRRGILSNLYFGNLNYAERMSLVQQTGANYMIAPVPEAYPQDHLFDFQQIGKTLVDGNQLRLIELTGPRP